jgi:hypothetical protein
MSDVDNQVDVLQRKLQVKTREIEALVVKEQYSGDLSDMDRISCDRVRAHVEELMYKWQEANVRVPGSNPDTPLNRLIAEREDIEQQIVELQVR